MTPTQTWSPRLSSQSPKEELCCFSTQKNAPPCAVITEQSCHRPSIIKEPCFFQYFRAYVDSANPCTFPLFKQLWRWTGVFEYPAGTTQFLLRLFEHTYAWQWLIKRFVALFGCQPLNFLPSVDVSLTLDDEIQILPTDRAHHTTFCFHIWWSWRQNIG